MRLIAPLLLLFLLMFAGAASATDYYVSTTGDNTTSGNITHPWQNVSYAAQQAVAGDTVYLFDGTWYNEIAIVAHSGNATHPITFAAYNGTPTIDNVVGAVNTDFGFYIADVDYINVSDITFNRCWYGGYTRRSNNTHVKNCTAYTYNFSGTTGKGFYIVDDSHHCTIENCTVTGDAWNSFCVMGSYYAGGGWYHGASTHNTIRGCTASNNTVHNFYDISGNISYITIENNIGYNGSQGGIFSHQGVQDHITIADNTFYDCVTGGVTGTGAGLWYSRMVDSIIRNNTIYDCPEGIKLYEADGFVVEDNTIYNITASFGIYMRGNNNLFTGNSLSDIHSSDYRIGMAMYGSLNNTVRNEVATTYAVRSDASAVTTVEYNDGTIFTENQANSPQWYPDHSNYTVPDGAIATITAYNVTLCPTNPYLKNVTVNHESDVADDRTNISVNSSVATNPTQIGATMQNTSNTYNVSIDGVYTTQVVSSAAKIVTYQYSDSWNTPHDFELEWHSIAGFSGAPDPTNLQSTKSTTWVNHTWDAGSGNVTDSYNVSVNSVWHNTTTNEYYYHIGMSAETWSNITVYAYNNTGGISQNGISQNIQTDAAGWSPSNTAMYYNTSSPITITTKTDGTNLFSRTPTTADGNATSDRLVVITS